MTYKWVFYRILSLKTVLGTPFRIDNIVASELHSLVFTTERTLNFLQRFLRGEKKNIKRRELKQ